MASGSSAKTPSPDLPPEVAERRERILAEAKRRKEKMEAKKGSAPTSTSPGVATNEAGSKRQQKEEELLKEAERRTRERRRRDGPSSAEGSAHATNVAATEAELYEEAARRAGRGTSDQIISETSTGRARKSSIDEVYEEARRRSVRLGKSSLSPSPRAKSSSPSPAAAAAAATTTVHRSRAIGSASAQTPSQRLKLTQRRSSSDPSLLVEAHDEVELRATRTYSAASTDTSTESTKKPKKGNVARRIGHAVSSIVHRATHRGTRVGPKASPNGAAVGGLRGRSMTPPLSPITPRPTESPVGGSLLRDDREKLHALFKKFDRTDSGNLTRGELLALLKEVKYFGLKPTSLEIQRLIKAMDTNAKGWVPYHHFESVLVRWLVGETDLNSEVIRVGSDSVKIVRVQRPQSPDLHTQTLADISIESQNMASHLMSFHLDHTEDTLGVSRENIRTHLEIEKTHIGEKEEEIARLRASLNLIKNEVTEDMKRKDQHMFTLQQQLLQAQKKLFEYERKNGQPTSTIRSTPSKDTLKLRRTLTSSSPVPLKDSLMRSSFPSRRQAPIPQSYSYGSIHRQAITPVPDGRKSTLRSFMSPSTPKTPSNRHSKHAVLSPSPSSREHPPLGALSPASPLVGDYNVDSPSKSLASFQQSVLTAAGVGGITPSYPDESNSSKLLELVTANELHEVEKLVKAHSGILSETDLFGRTMLHHAAALNLAEMIDKLVWLGADVNARQFKGETPLYVATAGDHVDAQRALLKAKADPDVLCTVKEAWTALHIAIYNGSGRCVRQLLEAKASTNSQSSRTGESPLHTAAGRRHGGLATTLLEHGADANLGSHSSMTPLHVACAKGAADVVDVLLKNKARMDAKDDCDRTPLSYALQHKHTAIVASMVRHDATLVAELDKQQTLSREAHVSSQKDFNWGEKKRDTVDGTQEVDEEVRSLLVTAPVTHTLITGGHLADLELFTSNGGSVSVRDGYGVRPLHLATRLGQLETVEHLLRCGVEIDSLTQDEKRSALHIACRHGLLEITRALLAQGADFHAKDANGSTPLALSVKGGDGRVSGLLLKYAKEEVLEDVARLADEVAVQSF